MNCGGLRLPRLKRMDVFNVYDGDLAACGASLQDSYLKAMRSAVYYSDVLQ